MTELASTVQHADCLGLQRIWQQQQQQGWLWVAVMSDIGVELCSDSNTPICAMTMCHSSSRQLMLY